MSTTPDTVSKKNAALHSLGCKVNSYETDAIALLLQNSGYNIVPFEEKADVYIINTCTVTAVSDKKSRQMIRRARAKNPEALVVACGCYVEKDAEAVRDDCDIIIGNNNKSEIIEKIDEFLINREKINLKTDLFSKDIHYENMEIDRAAEHTRAFVKIQDGCNAFCSYCIIPFVRGRSRSRAPEDIISEVKRLSENGYTEIVLSGINLSDYNYEGLGLKELIPMINEVAAVERIRIGSLEPNVFTKEFVRVLKESRKVCAHFHFSLQSACDKTLKNMGRRYTVSDFKEALYIIRQAYENPAICADVIAGFPGESDSDFVESFENIKTARLFELHVFPYSEREGTKAAKMDGRLSKAIKTERAARLINLSGEMSKEFRESFSGKAMSVLFEEKVFINDKEYWLGFSEEYIRCALNSIDNLRGRIIEVVPSGALSNEIIEVSLLL